MQQRGRRARVVGFLGRHAADITPLREFPAYRRLWGGLTVSMVGNQMTSVAVPIQVYDQTHSSLYVGLVGLAGLIGLLAFGLYGGAIADSMDRRRLALFTSSVLALLSAALVAQAALGLHSLPLLYGIVLLQAAVFGVDNPARSAMIPRLLPSARLPAAYALAQVGQNVALTGGPLAAGALIATSGLSTAYLVDTLSFAAALYAMWRLPAIPPEGGGAKAGWKSVAEGLRFLAGRKILLMTFLVDINAMVFGMPRALFPAIAQKFYGGGATVVGILYAAIAMGALLGATFGGWLGRVRRQGLAVIVAILAWGAAITGFGFTRALWLGVLLLAAAGAADMVSAVFRNTILQTATPDALRGRLSGVFIVVVAGGPRLGDVESGGIAAAAGLTASVASGGLLCILGVLLLAAAVPAFARYDASEVATTRRSETSPA